MLSKLVKHGRNTHARLQDGTQLLLVRKCGLQRKVELLHHEIEDEITAPIFSRPKSNDTAECGWISNMSRKRLHYNVCVQWKHMHNPNRTALQ